MDTKQEIDEHLIDRVLLEDTFEICGFNMRGLEGRIIGSMSEIQVQELLHRIDTVKAKYQHVEDPEQRSDAIYSEAALILTHAMDDYLNRRSQSVKSLGSRASR
jgi:hypothetical protein